MKKGCFEGRVVVGKMCCNNKMNGLEREKLLNERGVGGIYFLLRVERPKNFVGKVGYKGIRGVGGFDGGGRMCEVTRRGGITGCLSKRMDREEVSI